MEGQLERLINYNDFVSGRINLVSHLESFLGHQGYNSHNHNGKTVESMKKHIAENAESVQYSLDDSSHDAFTRIFHVLADRAHFIDGLYNV